MGMNAFAEFVMSAVSRSCSIERRCSARSDVTPDCNRRLLLCRSDAMMSDIGVVSMHVPYSNSYAGKNEEVA